MLEDFIDTLSEDDQEQIENATNPLREAYKFYEAAVAAFMESENLSNLSTGEPWCNHCDHELKWSDDTCPDCGSEKEYRNESYVSSQGCDCCGVGLQQNLLYASGRDKTTDEIKMYSICEDCEYYAEYGRLPDDFMDRLS